ncbi:3584_t:CDS:2 [Racocetra persica]|uniref:3584_t:CDS:1 n=1 Tax=Racocetra persica TaxID=160502 RepID=A0ACA9L089_9GLOM|nr:3584_t:CDS:2 [Racocetra persica]
MDYMHEIVVQSEDNILQPGFICTSGNSSSGIQTSLSTAITIDVYFIPIFLTLDTISIVISYIGDNTFNGFVSSLITKKEKNSDRYLVQQQIINNKFILDFYKETGLEFHYEDESVLEVWKKAKILAKYDRIALFGHLHSSVIQERSIKSIVMCSSQHWLSIEKLDAVFDRHIKSRKLNISSILEWHSLFFNWLKEGHSIIRLDKALQSVYLPTYQLQNKNIPRKHTQLYGPGDAPINVPKKIVKKMSDVREKEFELFFADKSNVTMGSYQVDKATIASHIKYRENLGELCQIYSQYGFKVFEDLIAIIRKSTFNTSQQFKKILKMRI